MQQIPSGLPEAAPYCTACAVDIAECGAFGNLQRTVPYKADAGGGTFSPNNNLRHVSDVESGAACIGHEYLLLTGAQQRASQSEPLIKTQSFFKDGVAAERNLNRAYVRGGLGVQRIAVMVLCLECDYVRIGITLPCVQYRIDMFRKVTVVVIGYQADIGSGHVYGVVAVA